MMMVLSEWEHVRGDDIDAELNPIKQMAVVVSGNHGAVFIDMIGNLEEEGCARDECINPKPNVGVQSALLAMRKENLEFKTSLSAMKVNLERGFDLVNGIVRRIALQPARRLAAPVMVVHGGGEADMGAASDLAMMAPQMPTPRSLHDLWSEYLHGGVGWKKRARLFSFTEQGCSKYR
jgi:hypothetical protein